MTPTGLTLQHLLPMNWPTDTTVGVSKWDGLIMGQSPSQWERGYKEHYYRIEATKLPPGSDWPRQQVYADFIFSNAKCPGGLPCGRQCIVGFTLYVGNEAPAHLSLPMSVAYHPHVFPTGNTSALPLFQAYFSYTLKVDLVPGINHIGWCGHSLIHYRVGSDAVGRSPTIHFGLPPTCFQNFVLDKDSGLYGRGADTYPTLYALGSELDPEHVSIFNPTNPLPTLKQLAIIGVGKQQFDWSIARQLCFRDMITRDKEDETIPQWNTTEYAVPVEMLTHRSCHTLHWLYLIFP